MHNVLHVEPSSPRDLNFSVSDCLGRVVLKALAKDPGERYATAEAMARALRECLKPNPDPAVLDVDPPEPAPLAGAATVVTGGADATIASQPREEATVVVLQPAVTDSIGMAQTISHRGLDARGADGCGWRRGSRAGAVATQAQTRGRICGCWRGPDCCHRGCRAALDAR